jgi:hypothetical protein
MCRGSSLRNASAMAGSRSSRENSERLSFLIVPPPGPERG